jgi:WW domain
MWTTAIDPSTGRTYYANVTTGESRWTPPPPPPALVEGLQDSHPTYQTWSNDQLSVGNGIPPHIQFDQQASLGAGPVSPTGGENQDKGIHSQSRPNTNDMVNSEWTMIATGKIADVCHIRQQQQEGGAFVPYCPINSAELSATRSPQELGRIRTRLHALHEQLKRI